MKEGRAKTLRKTQLDLSGCPDCPFQLPKSRFFFLNEILPAVTGNLSPNLNISKDKILSRTLHCLFSKALKFIAEPKLV